MPPVDPPLPRLGRLIASWLSLTGWLVWTCAARVQRGMDGAGQRLKDSILDLGCPPPDDPAEPALLPPVDPERLIEALRGPVEEALRRTADAINEDRGCPTLVTEEWVRAVFGDLAEQALAAAFECRVAAAEAGQRCPPGEWAARYRRMLAGERRWPPAGSASHEQHITTPPPDQGARPGQRTEVCSEPAPGAGSPD
jgi:hypothetical protein